MKTMREKRLNAIAGYESSIKMRERYPDNFVDGDPVTRARQVAKDKISKLRKLIEHTTNKLNFIGRNR
jgi:hypothetical protein